MIARIFTFVLLFTFSLGAVAQKTDTAFQREWLTIDTLIIQNDLTKTALARVDQIYKRAKQQQLPQQVVKSLLYRFTLEARVIDNNPDYSTNLLRTEIATSNDPAQRSILYSLLASQYERYYNQHRWNLYNRKSTTQGKTDSIATWSLDELSNAITRNYLLSIAQRSSLQQKKIEIYEAIIISGTARKLRPTLYDLLAHRALDYFKTGNIYTNQPVDAFVINNPAALGTVKEFTTAKFSTKDSTLKWHALQLFKDLINFHTDDIDKSALIDVDIERISWIYSIANFADKESVYTKTLEDIATRHANVPESSQAWYLLAVQQSNKARTYASFGDTSNRYAYVKAKEILDHALPMFPQSNTGTANMKRLLIDIGRKDLSTGTERVNLPGKPFRALVNYRNINILYARIIRINNDNKDLFQERWTPAFWKKLTEQPVYKKFTQVLPDTKDHQSHSVEIRIDELPVGAYALLTCEKEDFIDSTEKMSAQQFYVSNISFVQNDHDFFVLSRDNGKPIQGAKVVITDMAKVTNRITDKNGYFNYKTDRNSYSEFTISSGKDKLDMDMNARVYTNSKSDDDNEDDDAEDYEEDNKKMFFFTDRSIYRPGQTVFFKGIAVTKDFKTKLSKTVTSKETEWLYLEDANGKTIDSLSFTLNDYGSFCGKFQLPQNVLTGDFRFDVSDAGFDEMNEQFSVEEYKRPTFSISFDKKKGAYRLNDSITITGSVTAYSGNAITDAKVVYNVSRSARYMDPWYRSKSFLPSIASREVKQGEIKTDAQGKFSINFKALADDIIDKSGDPVFTFSISADITDISGETRSEETSLSIGFSAIQLKLNVPKVNEADSLKKIIVSATNMDNQPEPANVRVKIFSLQAPAKMARKRLWQRPDQFVMNSQEFASYFPTDEYNEETNYQTWATKELVKDATFDTKDNNGLLLDGNALKPGYYRIEVSTTDKYGVETKAVAYTELFSLSNTEQLPATQFTYIMQNQVEPEQTARFINRVFGDQIFFIRKTEREKNKPGKYEFVEKNRGYETVTFTPGEKDRGGVSITEAFVYDNRIYTHQYSIFVPWSNKSLQVQYETFRDKTEPGSKEKWTVSIKGDKKDDVAAELLTGMYDASLDQFKKHNWYAPDIWETKQWYNAFSASTNFTAEMSATNYIAEKYENNEIVLYDRIAANAYELARIKLMRRLDTLTYNMSPIDKQRIQLQLSPNAPTAQALMGRVAGVEVARDGSLNEVVVTGYGVQKNLTASSQTIMIRGAGSINSPQPLYVIDGVVTEFNSLTPDEIMSLSILKTEEATALYGSRAANGVVVVTTKKAAQKQPVVVRKNFNETAFFFPQLYADSSGKYSFTFTMPESLTQWKWMSFAHTKDLAFGTNSTNIITQKKLMIQANAPRFMREGDNMEFSGKIINMTEKEITGQVSLELIDPQTNTSIDGWFQNVFPVQYFTVEGGQSFAVKFPIQIPFSYNRPLTWRIKAVSGDMSDGEENTLPVLTNRMLVTETLPIFLPNDTTQNFVFEKLLNSKSESLSHEAITVEYSSNPVWYAVQALPYLMEYPYECAEQTFNRLYANALAAYIVNKNPKLKQVFEQWKADSSSLKSNLQKNEELKQILLQETPWVMQAESEAQQRKNISLLFDLVKLSTQTEALVQKLKQMQLPNGAFSWFNGGSEDRYITNYILTGIGKLKRLGALPADLALRLRPVLVNALKYADSKIAADYDWLVKNKVDLTKQQISTTQIDYLFMRSFFRDIAVQPQKEYDYYFSKGKQSWIKQNNYYKAELGLIYYRNNEEKFATETILPALLENMVMDSKQGMYWKTTYTNAWYQSPIEHQSMMIAFMSELNLNKPDASLVKNINAMKTWLLLNKQTNNWRTTIATAEACYALLLNGSDWLDAEKTVTIQLGKRTTVGNTEKTEAGTGYFKKRIDGKNVSPEMGSITVSVNSKNIQTQNAKANTSPSWGNIYWQYFEDLDKITPAATPLSLNKKLFIQRNTDKGVVLDPVKENQELKTGDKIIVRIELRSDRDMDYLHLKDMRAAAMEPVNVLSGYKWQNGLGYYESTKDASTNFFIDHLKKGTYVFDYPLFITHTGIFSVGIASIQCMYAPEFTSHSEGMKIRVAK
jgi:TonB-dependent SusC/RagA subfamily outer membrane receptor